jgi:hypothetical protein
VLSPLSRLAENDCVAAAATLSVLPVTLPVAVTFVASAGEAHAARAAAAKKRVRRRWRMVVVLVRDWRHTVCSAAAIPT